MTNATSTISTGFETLGVAPALVKNANASGMTEPKPIQAQAIPPHIAGRDVLAIAQTGSGKTAAFSMPILTKLLAMGGKPTRKTARALVLAPTRELAVQIEDTIKVLAKGQPVTTALVLGGVSRSAQVKRLSIGVDILIATPGRLTDLVREKDLVLNETRFLVLDEADRMLDMGFINDVKRIARATHPQRQTALYSATMPAEIEELANGFMKDPVRVAVAPQGTTAQEIKQSVHLAHAKQKRQVLAKLLGDEAVTSVLVFTRTKHGADKVTRNLEADGFAVAVIHGNKSQNARQSALNGFREGRVKILVATDIAARGIDVPGISHVVNYELPDEPESYVHRIGRTGRNGADGTAITLCDPSEFAKLRAVEKIIRMKLAVGADHMGTAFPHQDPAPTPRPAANTNNRGGNRNAAKGNRPQGHGKPAGEGARAKPQRNRRRFGGKPASKAA